MMKKPKNGVIAQFAYIYKIGKYISLWKDVDLEELYIKADEELPLIYRNFKYEHEHKNEKSWFICEPYIEEDPFPSVYRFYCHFRNPLHMPEDTIKISIHWKVLAEKKYLEKHFPKIYDKTNFCYDTVIRIK